MKDRAKGTRYGAHACRAVIAGLAFFALWQIGLGTLIEAWRPELRDPSFEIKYRQLTRLLRLHQEPPATILFMGSSMTANGVNAGLLEQPLASSLGRPVVSYNLAINGDGPLAHLIHMQRLLRRGIRPELVVVELSPLLCEVGQVKQEIRRYPPNLLEHSDLDIMERHADQPDLYTDWWQAHLVPIHGHRIMILNQSARTFVPFSERVELWTDADRHGWRGKKQPTPAEHERILEEIESQFKERGAKYKIDEVPLNALRELTELLAKERIATVFVLMPEGPLFRTFYLPERVAPVLATFAGLSRKHGFPLLSARDWFDEDKFRDSYHLHEQGANAFTERLLREIISPTMHAAQNGQRSRVAKID